MNYLSLGWLMDFLENRKPWIRFDHQIIIRSCIIMFFPATCPINHTLESKRPRCCAGRVHIEAMDLVGLELNDLPEHSKVTILFSKPTDL